MGERQESRRYDGFQKEETGRYGGVQETGRYGGVQETGRYGGLQRAEDWSL